MRALLISVLALGLSGCAADLYEWGRYEYQLHQQYRDPTKAEAARLELETHIRQVEQTKKQVAPGLYAELGTYYLEAGNKQAAIQNYELERDAWPESQALMNSMIQNLQRLDKKNAKEKAK